MNFIIPISLTNILLNYIHVLIFPVSQDLNRVYRTGLRIFSAKFRDRSTTASAEFHRSLRNRFRTNHGLQGVGTICAREIGSKTIERNRLSRVSVDYLSVTSCFFSNRNTAMIPRYETHLITRFAAHDQSCWDHWRPQRQLDSKLQVHRSERKTIRGLIRSTSV